MRPQHPQPTARVALVVRPGDTYMYVVKAFRAYVQVERGHRRGGFFVPCDRMTIEYAEHPLTRLLWLGDRINDAVLDPLISAFDDDAESRPYIVLFKGECDEQQ